MIDKPLNIGPIKIKNRLVRSATYDGMANKGMVTEKQLKLYKYLAEGGIGLIITGYAYVQKSGQGGENALAINDDRFIPDLRKIVDTVHKYGNDCKILCQLNHCGRQSVYLSETFAPSAILEKATNKMPKKMSIKEIEDTIEAFAQASRRAKKAGFDGIQLHGAHGWLISEFLSPYTNKRRDLYGGSLDHRLNFIKDIYERSIELVGKNYPIMIKINGSDFLEGGITMKESRINAQKLEKIGFDALEISGGMWEVRTRNKKELGWIPSLLPESRTRIGIRNTPAYNLPYAKAIKSLVDIPVGVVGGINSIDLCEKIIKEDSADFISLCSPLIREPNLPNRWFNGIGSKKVKCEYCNGCLSTLSTTGLRCYKQDVESK